MPAGATAVPDAVAEVARDVVRKDFATGSKGFHAQGKLVIDGGRYQAQVQAILVGSKTDPAARMIVKDEAMRQALATFAEDMAPRVFSSGKAGWYIQGKINVGGQRFQSSAQAVLLE